MPVLLAVHITAGAISVLAGAAALTFRKGARAHRSVGSFFVIAMVVMALTAAALGGDIANIVAGGMTIYFVTTAWVAARRGDKQAGWFEIIAFLVVLTFALGGFWTAYLIATGARPAANPYIVYANLFVSSAMALAALGDLSVVVRGGLSGVQRVARHLWRMCFGLLIAVGSFAAQGADALPQIVPGGPLLLGAMGLVLLVMLFWLVRVLFTRWYTREPAAAAA